MNTASPHQRLMQLAFAAPVSFACFYTTEIGLPDLIPSNGTRDVAELARETGSHERALYRVMRLLASHGIYTEQGRRQFGHTPLSRALRTDAPDSLKPAARLFNFLYQSLQSLDHSLKTEGSALSHVLGKPTFDYLGENPEMAALFDAAMHSFHGPETLAMLEAYDFTDVEVLADIGGGGGMLLLETLARYPQMRAILFDLEHVVERARPAFDEAGLNERCRLVAGSFFDSVPAGADAYLMRHIIHDWNDEDSIRILRNCREVVPSNGRLLIVEAVVPEGNEPSPAKDADIAMLLYPGGMERTELEYKALFSKSGFELRGVTPTDSLVSVVDARPV